MKEINKEFLYNYLNANSPVGEEMQGQKIWMNYIKPYVDVIETDIYGSCVGIINPESKFKVVIEAHADEISWLVNYISKEGYIYVIRNGGSDYQIAPSQKAKIHGAKGTVTGVFGWPAIHIRNDIKSPFDPKIENIILDCGCNSKDEVANLGIEIGDIVTFDSELFELPNGYLTGRALDNRIGGFTIAEVARKLKEEKVKLDFGLYVVNAVQEEVGLRGAGMMADRIKPDIAIITDVTHDTHSPLYSKIKEGDVSCKKGPAICIAPAIQRNLLKIIIEIAKNNKIPFQKVASSRVTGTDADAFAYSNSGIASALVSLPLKYMHTTVETIHMEDITHLINLFYYFIKDYDKDKMKLSYF